MNMLRPLALAFLLLLSAPSPSAAEQYPVPLGTPLPETAPLKETGDLAAGMVAGIDAWLDREIDAVSRARAITAPPDDRRARLAKIIGALDPRAPAQMFAVSPVGSARPLAKGPAGSIYAVRWPVFRGVFAEGLLLEPAAKPRANVVALPDCDDTPEQLAGLVEGLPAKAQFARELAVRGCRVLIPVLIDRADTWSGHEKVRMTNQPHREFVYRPAYQMGRHIIGYEVQKVLAGVDWFTAQDDLPVGVMGYGEGGLLALYAAALDERIDATVVSGYFQPRERLWSQPIYRNVWGLLREFGDAELTTLVVPRALVVEASNPPEVTGPPPAHDGRSGAAPGAIVTPALSAVEQEVERARRLSGGASGAITMTVPAEGAPGSRETIEAFLRDLKVPAKRPAKERAYEIHGALPDAAVRMKTQVENLLEDTQALVRESPYVRKEFWGKADATNADAWRQSAGWYRDYFASEVIGALPAPSVPPAPKSRLIYDEPEYLGYEVTIDVQPDVFAYGILLVPKNIAPGELRPVVVCQHGLEGRPQDVADIHVDSPYYHAFGAQLAKRGYVVFAPQNPYIGEDKFRVLQRKANPLKLSLFSFIVQQHQAILDWLKTQPYVDPARMAFYGLSYGGKTAMRVPAILQDYCLSICSGDFNEWIWKNTSTRSNYSYVFTGEYEMFEFDLGNTFNYGEMSWLIFPRPFMVERGHDDGVAPDEWVAYEYARVRRLYDQFDAGGRTTLEFFNGPHTIHGVGTFDFLDKHLNRPPVQKGS